MRINNNIMAMNAHRQLAINQSNASKSMEKLSSGFRINRAGDDAAGLAISEKMRGQIRGLKQAQRNAQDGISLIQTAEGALNETHAILQRMRELAVQAANDTNTEVDRSEIQKEINELIDEIDRIANQTQFNTKHLLNGTFTGTFHIGANETQSITLTIGNMAAGRAPEVTFDTPVIDQKLDGASVSSVAGFDKSGEVTFSVIHSAEDGLYATIDGEAVLQTVASEAGEMTYTTASGKSVTADLGTINLNEGESVDIVINVTVEDVPDDEKGLQVGELKVENVTKDSVGGIMTQAGADKAITVINDAIEAVSAERSKLGAYQNRLEHTISNLGTSAENLQAAESRIRDLDMAEEIMAFTKNNILQQAATAMLAQANMAPQSVLQLLG